jgi:hypothetical protein
MIVLSYGMLKSGSTLAFELCKSVLTQSKFVQRHLPDGVVAPGFHINFFDHISVPILSRALQDVAPSEIIAIKTHSAIGPADKQFIETAVAEGQMKVQVNLRDPREMCLSLLDAGASARQKKRQAFSEITALEQAARIVEGQLAVCRNWGSIPGATYLHYNEVAFETAAAVRQICNDLELEMFESAALQTVIDRVLNEAFTQRNKAVKDRYKDDLTVRQNETLLTEIRGAQPFIRRVCEQRDYGWFARPLNREAAPALAAAGNEATG